MQGKWIGVVLAACIMTTGCATRQAEKTAAPATPDVQAQVKPSTQQEPRASAAPSQSKLPAPVPDTKSQTHEPERGKADAAPANEEQRGFETRYARFEPAEFSDIPAWQNDRVQEAWRAFLRGCKTLTAKQLWAGTCTQAAQVPATDEKAVRRFLEQQFVLYQVLDPHGDEGGIITGYYEPLLKGNRVADERFRFPVYAVPADMLYLDSHRLPKSYPKQKAYARVEGHTVVPLATAVAPGPGIYPVEAGAIGSDIRDRRLRVRLDRNRIVRYYTRNEIETTRLPAAKVLVWVEDPIMLYTMQVQGTGKVQLPDGRLMRLGFADQNGYPFRSKIKYAAYKPSKGAVRGGAAAVSAAELEHDDADDLDEDSVDAELDSGNPVAITRSLKVKRDPPTREELAARQARDPSYVFFRELPDTPEGPIGALGVPLTPERSVAVDPRITPLGAPLFLSTKDPRTAGDLNKLVVAQDTGGAIRGALRADYFFGFGPGAGELANRMRNEGRLWLLLPKSFRPNAAMVAGRTRGAALVECVVPDAEYCGEAGSPESAASTAQQ